jgi:hypothetical protein
MQLVRCGQLQTHPGAFPMIDYLSFRRFIFPAIAVSLYWIHAGLFLGVVTLVFVANFATMVWWQASLILAFWLSFMPIILVLMRIPYELALVIFRINENLHSLLVIYRHQVNNKQQ